MLKSEAKRGRLIAGSQSSLDAKARPIEMSLKQFDLRFFLSPFSTQSSDRGHAYVRGMFVPAVNTWLTHFGSRW